MAAANYSALRIVLLGHTGAGKSASGNTILLDHAFTEDCCPHSVTRFCEKKVGFVENREISVVDTPGINDTKMTQEEQKREVEKCIQMCAPGPQALLLVIRLSRYTKEQQGTVKWIQENFGEGALKHSIVLFTGKGDLKGKSIETFLSESCNLQELVHSCGGRYHAFDNNQKRIQQVTDLFSKIDQMLKINNVAYYAPDTYQKAQEAIMQRKKKEKQKLEDDKKAFERNIRQDQCEKIVKQVKIHYQAGGAAAGGVIGLVAGLCYGNAPGATVGKKVGAATGGLVAGAVGGFVTGMVVGNSLPGVVDEVKDSCLPKDKND